MKNLIGTLFTSSLLVKGLDAMPSKCLHAAPATFGSSLVPGSIPLSNEEELTSHVTPEHRLMSIKLCKDIEDDTLQRIQFALGIPDINGQKWTKPFALNGFGSYIPEQDRCEMMPLKPGAFIK